MASKPPWPTPWSKYGQRACIGPVQRIRFYGKGIHTRPTVEVCDEKRKTCVTFDRRIGSNALGVTGHNDNIEYMGAVVPLTPTEFLRLTTKRVDDPVHVRKHIVEGGSVGNPMLYIETDTERGVARVTGHEGRGRMMTTRSLVGDKHVPVHVIVREAQKSKTWGASSVETRARHWSEKIVAALACTIPERLRETQRYDPPVRGLFRNGVVGGKAWSRG